MSGSESDESTSDLAHLINTRKYVRQRITKNYNKVCAELATLSEEDKLLCIDRLESLKKEVNRLDKKIFSLHLKSGMKDEDIEARIDENEKYEEKIVSSLSRLRSITNVVPPASYASASVTHNKLKLPQMPLPEFSADKDQSLDKFFHNLESIINKHALSSYEKFVYLRNQLSNSPRVLIDSLDIQEQSYEKAKELLTKAFASPLTKKYEAIQRLSEIKLGYNDDPYTFIGDMRSITNAFNSLDIDVDTILQYFFWKGLNDRFQTHFIQITNKSKPSLSEINDNIFEATERYTRHNEKIKEIKSKGAKCNTADQSKGKTTTALATNVKTGKSEFVKQCNLCASDGKTNIDHTIRDCSIYSTPKQKVDKLKSLNACTRCTFANHETKGCKFRFSSRCRVCNGFHFTYLCIASCKDIKESNTNRKTSKSDTNNTKGENDVKASTSNGVALVEVLRNSTGDSVILPTFSCDIHSKVGKETVRVLRDSGCQRNFIEESIAIKNKLHVIDHNVDLDIHGFNATKSMKVKLVEVPLMIGNKIVNVNALCIPEIRTKLRLEGINKVVAAFTEKGYVLADKFLLENDREDIANIGLLLGEDGDHVLEFSSRHFGEGVPSTYLETPIGIILTGNIQRMLGNLPELPNVSFPPCSPNCEPSSVTENSLHINTSVQLASEDHPNYLKYFSSNVSCKDVLVGCVDLEIGGETQNPQCDVNEVKDTHIVTSSNSVYSVLNEKGQVIMPELEKATKEILDRQCSELLNYDNSLQDINETETNVKLVNYVLDNTERSEDGRLVMPLMWNSKIAHLLGKNFNLSKQILKSNLRKLKRTEGGLEMVDNVFKEQEKIGIIERIENVDEYRDKHPECCFLPHMAVFKMDRTTTKCRVVFLSNLCEKNQEMPLTVSNNQAMMAGPCLNHKITTTVMLLRFDLYLILFDIQKAFLNIGLKENDQNRLMFLWYKNVEKGDLSLIAYRNQRLSFGLRASPSILMLGLFKILLLDIGNDEEKTVELKRSVFNLIYMDNGGYSSNNLDTLHWSYKELERIFEPYRFYLQQFATNNECLQKKIDEDKQCETPSNVKLFGMTWNREKDTISPLQIQLDAKANTKRLILGSLRAVYDIFNILGPIMNRGNLFLQKLMIDKSLDWDTVLPDSLQREWCNIVKQANATPEVSIRRFVGKRNGQYRLIAFSDSSKSMYATVIYIQDIETNQVSFLTAKNRLVGQSLQGKSIPSLEFLGICLGVEMLIEIYQDLSGSSTVVPIRIERLDLFSDSMVSLHWLQSYAENFDKMQKRSIFIMNRLRAIDELCRVFPVSFHFVEGCNNPADYLTRPMSYKQLVKTNYFTGPEFLLAEPNFYENTDMTVIIPNPAARLVDEVPERSDISNDIALSIQANNVQIGVSGPEHFIPLDKFSGFSRLASVHSNVLRFINNIKLRLAVKNRLTHLRRYDYSKDNLYQIACNQIISTEQQIHYPEIFEYFKHRKKSINSMPNLVSQLNLILSKDNLLKVKSKFGTCAQSKYPILLPKNSKLTNLIIRDLHVSFSHAGIYTLLKELRKEFWITHYYSTVRKMLRQCITCKRLNERSIKLNQSSYRDFRVEPPSIPFRYVCLDYMGPFNVTWNGKKSKVWILIITCMWSRAINMKICINANVKEFLRALQLHIFEYGIFELCISDLGSQIVAGCNIISSFLEDCDTQIYLEKHGIKAVKFDHFSKGNSSLGSLVESCVKLTKKLMHGAVKNSVLDYLDFNFIVCQTVHIVNRRPIAFKESLRNNNPDENIKPITPEALLKGYDLVSVNVIPELQVCPDSNDPEWLKNENLPETVRSNHSKLLKARDRLTDLYHTEFLANLIQQAVNEKGRYKPVFHKHLQVGDIVLLKDKFLKPSTYPLGIVKRIEVNNLEEVTAAYVFKGATRELVYRHSSSLIRLIPNECIGEDITEDCTSSTDVDVDGSDGLNSKKRRAAIESQRKTKLLTQTGLA